VENLSLIAELQKGLKDYNVGDPGCVELVCLHRISKPLFCGPAHVFLGSQLFDPPPPPPDGLPRFPFSNNQAEYGRYLLDGDVKMKLDIDGKIFKRYIFLFQKGIVVCKQRFATPQYLYAMFTRDYKVSRLACCYL